MATQLDWVHVNVAVEETQKSLGIADITKSFPHFCCDQILSLDPRQTQEAITDGTDDRGIDAVYIDGNTTPITIHLFSFKYHRKADHFESRFPANEVSKICTFINELCNRSAELLKNANNLLAEKVRDIYSVEDRGLTQYKVHICSNGQGLLPNDRERFINHLKQFKVFELIEHDLDCFSGYLLGSVNKPINKKIFAIDKPIEKSNGDLRGLVVTVSAETLVDLIKNPSLPKQINAHIFNNNVRNYLGTQNEINNRIYDSAISEKNYRFWYLNNGITITCSKFSYSPMRNPIIELMDVQIVNGLQTSSAVFEAYQIHPEKLQDVQLLIRIYETQDYDLSLDICEATNSQTRIRSRDLVANHPVQKKIESILKPQGIFYERKKNTHLGKDPSQRLDILKLGQICLSYFMERPEAAKAASDQIFKDEYDEIFGEDFQVLAAVPILKLFRDIENEQKRIQEEMKAVNGRLHPYAFVSYAAYHVLFAAKIIAEKLSIDIRIDSDNTELIRQSLEVIKEVVSTNGTQSFYQLFRATKTRRDIERVVGVGQLDLFRRVS